jgi:hypothetical protein
MNSRSSPVLFHISLRKPAWIGIKPPVHRDDNSKERNGASERNACGIVFPGSVEQTEKEMIFLYKTIFFGLGALILLPKEHYKKFFVYGLFWGAFVDVVIISILSGLFHWIHYKNMGSFNILNLFSFWTPLAWLFVMMVFFYCLPDRRLFLLFYIPGFGLFGYMVGMVLHNFGLFEFRSVYKYFAPFILIGWFTVAAWAYIKTEKITLK